MRIVTHTGAAHLDELVACGLFLASARIMGKKIKGIVRTNTISEEHGADAIIDIGGVYDGIRLFDHHQKEEAVLGKCAAELVCEVYFPELMADEEFGPFIKMLSFMDNNGPMNTGKEYGIKSADLNSLLFIARGLVKRFETEPMEMAELMADIICQKLDSMKEIEDAIDFYSDTENATCLSIGTISAMQIKNPWTGSLFAGNKAQEKLIKERKLDLVYNFDPRIEGGRCLFRTFHGEAAGIVLKPEMAKNTSFCHKAGFLLNFTPSHEDEWKEIVGKLL